MRVLAGVRARLRECESACEQESESDAEEEREHIWDLCPKAKVLG